MIIIINGKVRLFIILVIKEVLKWVILMRILISISDNS